MFSLPVIVVALRVLKSTCCQAGKLILNVPWYFPVPLISTQPELPQSGKTYELILISLPFLKSLAAS